MPTLIPIALLLLAADPSPPLTPDAIAKAVRELGADDYQVREAATLWLWAAGPAAENALKAGLKSTDAEVVVRCRDLLDKIPYGITANMPPRFVDLIGVARAGGPNAWPTVVPELLDLGPRGLEVAQKLIDRIATAPGQREAMLRTLDLHSWRVARHFLAAGTPDRAGEVLERSAVANAATPNDLFAVRHYAAFLAARGQLSTQLARWQALATKHAGSAFPDGRMPDGDPDGRTSLAIVVHLARLAGDLKAARKAADKTGREELREAVLFEQGAWTELAKLSAPITYLGPTGPGLKAMYLAAAGKTAAANEAIAELKKSPVTPSGSVGPPNVFCALMYAGRPTDALGVLAAYEPTGGQLPAFDVLCQLHRYDEAFPRLSRAVGERTFTRWKWDTAKLRVYHQRGEADQYRETLAALRAFDEVNRSESSAALDLIDMLVSIYRRDDALPIVAALLNSGAAPAEVFGKLYPKAALAAETWWRYGRLKYPNESMRATIARLPALMDKRLAEPEGRAALADATMVARAQPDADADRWLQGLAEACQSADLTAEARACAKEAAERTKSAAAYLRLGDLYAEAAQFADAAAAYDGAWQADNKQSLPLWLRGWALEKAGQPGGKEARELAHTQLLGHEDARLKFAEDLTKRSAFGPELAAASSAEVRLVVRLTGPAYSAGHNSQRLIRTDREMSSDHLAIAAADLRYLMLLLHAKRFFYRNQDYLNVLHHMATNRARGLLDKGDMVGAVREADAAMAFLPGHSEPAAVLVSALAKKGYTAKAEHIYEVTVTEQDRLCKDYPQSAEFRNNRAWTAACCRRDLDLAVDYARKAVELAPTMSGYRETLAEALFQHGDKATAVDEIKRCIEMEPKNKYFARQRQRIEAGDPTAALPER
jgi:hypothetical protein